jgi:hypothetical protein
VLIARKRVAAATIFGEWTKGGPRRKKLISISGYVLDYFF